MLYSATTTTSKHCAQKNKDSKANSTALTTFQADCNFDFQFIIQGDIDIIISLSEFGICNRSTNVAKKVVATGMIIGAPHM